MAKAWYVYDGMGSPFLISSYNFIGNKPTCVNGCKVCAIYAPNGGPTPSVLSNNIRLYIINLMASPISQPTEPVGTKNYVYGKNC
ncbi:hypothetical protein ABIB30_005254 [Pedobacter sp. UYP1]|jgi:hypothetical protein